MLLKHIEGFAVFKSNHPKISQTLEHIKTFSDRLEPYFEVGTIVLQTHPEWTAIAWGAFRLILKVGNSSVVVN